MLQVRWEAENQSQTATFAMEGELTIGRQAICDVVIPHQTISRQHARLTFAGGRLRLENLSSTNPVELQDGLLLQAGETTELHDGSVIKIGAARLYFNLSDLDERVQFKVRCTNCGKVSDNSLSDCPWCGTSLAFGETFIPTSGEN